MTAAPSNEAIAFVEENGMPCNEREFASDLDRFAAQRGAELCERLEREFGIPKLILLGQANAGEITEADKAWAAEIISKREKDID